MEEKKYTIEEIKKACENYDNYHEDYPESRLEGLCVFEWINEELTNNFIEFIDRNDEDGKIKYINVLELQDDVKNG